VAIWKFSHLFKNTFKNACCIKDITHNNVTRKCIYSCLIFLLHWVFLLIYMKVEWKWMHILNHKLHIRQCELEAIKCGTLKIFSTSHLPSIVLDILYLESKFKFLFSLNRFQIIAQLLSLLTFKLSCHLIL
jgi:hypothetical protein